jgi:hypothetical protein
MRYARNISIVVFFVAAFTNAPPRALADPAGCVYLGYHCPTLYSQPPGFIYECDENVSCEDIADCMREACAPYGFSNFCGEPAAPYGGAAGGAYCN